MALRKSSKGTVRHATVTVKEGETQYVFSCQIIAEVYAFALALALDKAGKGETVTLPRPKDVVPRIVAYLSSKGVKDRPKDASLAMRVGIGFNAAIEPYKVAQKTNGVGPQVRLLKDAGYANPAFSCLAKDICKQAGLPFVDRV